MKANVKKVPITGIKTATEAVNIMSGMIVGSQRAAWREIYAKLMEKVLRNGSEYIDTMFRVTKYDETHVKLELSAFAGM